MCELMGLSFAGPISAGFSIREFACAGEENADGWGLAWYPDRSLALVKEPVEWRKSKYTRFLESYTRLQSSIYIAHVRHKTTGGAPTHADSHPFARELAGRDYCFAHNGTIAGAHNLPLGRFQPVGGTDSEQVFCNLLGEIERRESTANVAKEPLGDRAAWTWLHGKLLAVNEGGKLNCLFTDGRRLYCYHDMRGYKGLCLRAVHMSDQETRHFEDETVEVNLDGENANHGYVIATRPLSSSGWEKFEPGELIVFEAGEIRFSTTAGRA